MMNKQNIPVPDTYNGEIVRGKVFSRSHLPPSDYPTLIEIRDSDGRLLAGAGDPLPYIQTNEVELNPGAEIEPEVIIDTIYRILESAPVIVRLTTPTPQREYQYIAGYFTEAIERANPTTTEGQREIDLYKTELIEFIEYLDPIAQPTFINIVEKLTEDIGQPIKGSQLEPIREKRRQILSELRNEARYREAVEQAGTLPAPEGREYLERALKELKQGEYSYEFKSLATPPSTPELIEALSSRPERLKTGYTIKDKRGDEVEIEIPAGALTFIAGATGHGKTTLLVNLLLRLKQSLPGKRFYLLSYEEPASALIIKTFNTYQGGTLNPDNRRSLEAYFKGETKYIHQDHHDRLANLFTEYAGALSVGQIVIKNTDLTSDRLRDFIEYLGKQEDTGAVFIDYVQLIKASPDTRYNSRVEELKKVCIELKDGAVNSGLPVILGAQFNRIKSPEDIATYNIGEAGDIERIANLILGIWNNNQTDETLRDKRTNEGKYRPNTLYIEILKNRDGKAGTWGLLSWDGNAGVVDNLKQGY